MTPYRQLPRPEPEIASPPPREPFERARAVVMTTTSVFALGFLPLVSLLLGGWQAPCGLVLLFGIGLCETWWRRRRRSRRDDPSSDWEDVWRDDLR